MFLYDQIIDFTSFDAAPRCSRVIPVLALIALGLIVLVAVLSA